MTSRRSGGLGGNGPPSSPNSSSEDNGFTSRPKVAGLYVKNLSREELEILAEEGIYGPLGDPQDRREDRGSQRSLDQAGPSKEVANPSWTFTSRTPQPKRKSRAPRHRSHGRKFEELQVQVSQDFPSVEPRVPECRFDEINVQVRDKFSVPEMEEDGGRVSGRRLDDSQEQVRKPVGAFVSGETNVPGRDEDSVKRTWIQDDPNREFPGQHPLYIRNDEIQSTRRSPPLYDDPNPPEYDYEDSLSSLFPRCVTRPMEDRKEEKAEDLDSTFQDRVETASESGAASPGIAALFSEAPPSPEASGSPIPGPNHESGGSPPKRPPGSKTQDSTRLRPPLAGTAGTSADSGTGDSGSAEIQAEPLGTPQPSGPETNRTPEIEGKSPGARTPGKGGKQQVKPFTKESLDRLENRTVQLVREYGFQPRRKTSVEDGAVLPNKFEPFPANLYGRPLEEIDNFIYDEVSEPSISHVTVSGHHPGTIITLRLVINPHHLLNYAPLTP
ncbi:uncharacterized protein LOC111674215 [Orussus abietinus]|uniref:uncharacterized protein LOC111674215 n=1 Tax=Orussus abietinus TaxID=222816 RepID=UPI000C715CE0|nr:uncharacterized protein LOC111674215 [Orussus abietinus]